MNSTTKIIAGVAVLALLFAGIGFAADYTASTTSTENEIGIAYITVNDGVTTTDGAKLIATGSSVTFNSETNAGVVILKEPVDAIGSGTIVVKNGGTGVAYGVKVKITPDENFDNTLFTLKIGDTPVTYNNGYEYEIGNMDAGATSSLTVQFNLANGAVTDKTTAASITGPFTFDILATASTTATTPSP